MPTLKYQIDTPNAEYIYYWSFLSSLLSLSTWNLVFAGESQEEEEVNSEEALAMSSPSTTVSQRIVVHVDIVFLFLLMLGWIEVLIISKD